MELEEAKTTSATKTTPRSDFDYEDDDDEVIWRGTSTTTAAATTTTTAFSSTTTAVWAKTSTQTTTATPRWKTTTSSVKEEDEEKDPTLGDSKFDDEYLSDDSEYYSSGEGIQKEILNSVLRIRDVYQKFGYGIRDPEKNCFPDSGSRIGGSKRHRILDPDPQHC
jgi:hypothetical protein